MSLANDTPDQKRIRILETQVSELQRNLVHTQARLEETLVILGRLIGVLEGRR